MSNNTSPAEEESNNKSKYVHTVCTVQVHMLIYVQIVNLKLLILILDIFGVSDIQTFFFEKKVGEGNFSGLLT